MRHFESIRADDIRILGLGSLVLLGRQVLTDHGADVGALPATGWCAGRTLCVSLVG